MPTRGRSRVLILSDEPMSAALLALLLERDVYEPAFPNPGETAEAALRRVRPLLVILLDERLDVARSDLFFTRAERAGARVILWGAPARSAETASLARARRLASFALPITASELSAILARATGSDERRGTGSERRHPTADSDIDALIFTDRHGRRWQVYDRRSRDRRQPTADATPASVDYRIFVNEAGEEWRYRFGEDELIDASQQTLERQLAAALPG